MSIREADEGLRAPQRNIQQPPSCHTPDTRVKTAVGTELSVTPRPLQDGICALSARARCALAHCAQRRPHTLRTVHAARSQQPYCTHRTHHIQARIPHIYASRPPHNAHCAPCTLRIASCAPCTLCQGCRWPLLREMVGLRDAGTSAERQPASNCGQSSTKGRRLAINCRRFSANLRLLSVNHRILPRTPSGPSSVTKKGSVLCEWTAPRCAMHFLQSAHCTALRTEPTALPAHCTMRPLQMGRVRCGMLRAELWCSALWRHGPGTRR